MSHASLLTWIPWEMKQSVAVLRVDVWSPPAKASRQIDPLGMEEMGACSVSWADGFSAVGK